MQRHQHRDQLSPGYDKGVLTADEVISSCEEQLESEYSPEMQWWTEKCLPRKEILAGFVSLWLNSPSRKCCPMDSVLHLL